MSRNGKVIVAMSGGVDSSVAACLLKEQGYECIGAFMRVGAAVSEDEACSIESASGDAHQHAGSSTGQSEPGAAAQPRRNLRHGCCSATDALDARVIAGKLDIPFYSLNFQRDFDRIIDYFVDEYAAARTPNPCIQCNVHLKFGKLLRYADLMDAEFIATGHYARTLRADDAAQGRSQLGVARLARAVNRAKDQSYVLFGIQREDLRRCLFPIGAIADKAEVRRIAERLGLRVHDKPDSQEICFVPGDDYRTLVRGRRPGSLQPGEFRGPNGRVVGRHEGVPAYTIGQRRGLGLALGSPVYVTALNVLDNTVTVGAKEDLLADGLIADRLNWHADPPLAGQWLPVQIKIRHQHTPAAGRFRMLVSGEVEARFDQPQIAVTPGQAAVFYDGEFVLGGGWICRSIRATERKR